MRCEFAGASSNRRDKAVQESRGNGQKAMLESHTDGNLGFMVARAKNLYPSMQELRPVRSGVSPESC